MREVSRRKEVECFKCGEKQMVPVKLTYEKYAYMTPQERADYAESWQYIHRSDKQSLETFNIISGCPNDICIVK